jgi:hypothetical protein
MPRLLIVSPKTRRYFAQFMIISAIIFLLFFTLAILTFPGGTYLNANAPGYSWTQNFFSDLGRAHSYNGETSTPSRVLFTISLAWIGFAFLPFMIAWRSFFINKPLSLVMSNIGAIAGVVAGLGYAVVAFTPWDLYFPIHLAAVQTAFAGVLIMSICFSVAMFAEMQFSKTAPIILSTFSVIAFAYLMLLFFGPDFKTHTGLIIQVVGQKIIVVSQVLVLLSIAFILRRMAISRN